MKNRVTAEFTFDLDQGAVYPSQNYLAQGREKLDVLTSAQLDRIPAGGENGYICQIRTTQAARWKSPFSPRTWTTGA